MDIKKIIERFKGLSTIGISFFISQAIYGIFWITIAPLLGTEQYGEVSYLIAIASIASTIAFIGSGNTILVYTPKKINLEASIFSVTIISSLITAVVLFILLQNIEISLFVIGFVIFGLSINELLGKQLYKKYAKYLISQRILQVVLSLFFYFILGPNGIILGFALSYLIYINRIRLILKERKNYPLLKSKMGFMSNSYVLDLGRTFSIYTDKLIVLPLFGFTVLGNYQLGIQYLTILAILPNVVFQYILPHDSVGKANAKLKVLTILVAAILAIISIVLVPLIFPIFFVEFFESIILIQILSIAIIPKTISMMYMSKYLGLEKSKIVVVGSGIYITTQILGILFLGDFIGIEGIAWALVIASSLEAIFLTSMRDQMK
jgi:O-antigen/teichoic acid export membrane protein